MQVIEGTIKHITIDEDMIRFSVGEYWFNAQYESFNIEHTVFKVNQIIDVRNFAYAIGKEVRLLLNNKNGVEDMGHIKKNIWFGNSDQLFKWAED